ncbi:MAG TPA: hypothetical protein VN281_11540, partial [Verrucomicrobiae bacterium]|nr:hypothetical protein [Verrucomicrobiae bacterium]
EHTELFGVVDKKQKIYSRKTTATLPYLHAAADPQAGKATLTPPPRQDTAGPAEFQREADRLALGRYAPVGVLINDNLDILQFRGRTDAYLSPPVGEAKLNLHGAGNAGAGTGHGHSRSARPKDHGAPRSSATAGRTADTRDQHRGDAGQAAEQQ